MRSQIALFVIMAVSFRTVPIQAQARNPAYLNQMPTAERVKEAVNGSDRLDTAARQLGALWQLRNLVYDMAATQHRDRNHVTTDETRLADGYMDAYTAILQPIDRSLPDQEQRQWYRLHSRYQNDRVLRDTLFQKFFTRDVRDAVYSVLGEKPPPAAATLPTSPPSAQTSGESTRAPLGEQDRLAVKAYVTHGDKALTAKDYPGAIGFYKKAINLDPNCGMARYGLALCYYQQGQWELSVAAWKRTRDFVQLDASAWILLGDAQRNSTHYNEALDAYRNVIHMESESHHAGMANHRIGLTYLALKQYDRAASAFREALRIEPRNAIASNDLGVAYRNMEKYPDAVAAFQQAVLLKHDYAAAYLNLGNTYRDLKQFDKAAAAFHELLRLDPKSADANLGIGLAYFFLKRYEEAVAALQEDIRLDPTYANAYRFLGLTYLILHRKDDALKVYEKLKTIDAAAAEELRKYIK